MLRRAENCGISFKKNFFGTKGKPIFRVGKKPYELVPKVMKTDYDAARNKQLDYPVRITRIADRTYWQFQNFFYWDNDGLKVEQIHALLVTRQQRERARIERAEAMVSQGFVNSGNQRDAIPDDLKQYVWTRDGGKCRSCGATSELQFDHVIPVALGGATNEQNLQILCGPCNRRKGAGLTTR
jgi:hypothetical protein